MTDHEAVKQSVKVPLSRGADHPLAIAVADPL
jgi:hypothetical protein